MVATKRLGQAVTLETEYCKNNLLGPNQEILTWMLSGYLGITLLGLLSNAFVSSLSAGMAYAGIDATKTGIAATIFQLLFWISAFAVAYCGRRSSLTWKNLPIKALIAMFVAMIALPFVSPLATSTQAKIAERNWIAETYLWIGFGHFSIQMLIYAFCFVALNRLSRSSNLGDSRTTLMQ